MSSNTYHDILTKKEFEVNGETQKLWFKAGNIKTLPNGRMFMTLFHQPNTDFYIFGQSDEALPVIH